MTAPLCAECHEPYRPEPHNHTGFCSWACFDVEERPGAPEAFAAFLGADVVVLCLNPTESQEPK